MKLKRRMGRARSAGALLLIATVAAAGIGCGQSNAEAGGENPRAGQGGPGGGRPGGRGGGPPGGFPGFPGFGEAAPASTIPVRVTSVVRRDIADYLETNGALEAENEVDIVARTTGPIVELNVEEGDFVRAGQVLARIDAAEIEAQLGIARVNLAEAELAWNRAQDSFQAEVVSQEAYDLARSNFDSAAAQIVGTEILLDYTVIRAPFDGLIIERVIRNAEHVSTNARLFRISDFDPLLCPIQLPEKDLPRLKLDQPGYLTVEAYPGLRFPARVLRISPVVDAATGTVKVTLEVQAQGRLRPGMFASAFVETDVHENAIVVPKQALVLESTSDTVYVAMDDGEGGAVAQRRELELGYEESDSLEVLSGLSEGEDVVILGQDNLSDQTPISVAEREGPAAAPGMFTAVPATDGGRSTQVAASQATPAAAGAPAAEQATPQPRRPAGPGFGAPGQGGPGGFRGGPAGGFDPSQLTPERLEMMRARMKERGMSDEQIDQMMERIRSGQGPPGRPPGGPPGRQQGGPPG
ncbi:MAG: efflux RND transporter periplasmic adaptor subunit [Holophagales bacterium]|nr:efflux RND transporter periplasmic adaptor subunit [Holophagales bacterium]MYG28862.1 efflux RND transporter periplasmic adaptor subunit [Holophagales bacterium]MYI80816.1 efflux RND transporter periplasmic adaptor subunit [Holophagales bacterium]